MTWPQSASEYREWLVQVFTFASGLTTSAFVNIATDLRVNHTALRVTAMICFFGAACACFGSAYMIQRVGRQIDSSTVGLSVPEQRKSFDKKLRGWPALLLCSAILLTLAATAFLVADV